MAGPGVARAVAVAFSGGRDSTALLHATATAASRLGIAVHALHVHHGLSASADSWRAHGEALCRRWARRGLPVEFAACHLVGGPPAGASVEAWARAARYAALRDMAIERGVDLVLLAHHRRDQAETFLLQALRGGGAAALASMPRSAHREGVTWARPWLEQPRETIESYARAHRLRWVEDDSNADDRFARNRLRRQVWPALVAAFGDAEVVLAAAAKRAAHAAAVLDEVARSDLGSVADAGGLDLVRWRLLSAPRQREALLAWLRRELPAPAPASLVERLLGEAAVHGHRRWPVSGGELSSHRGRLQFAPLVRSAGEGAARVSVDLSQPGVHEIAAWNGAFRVKRVERGGIAVTEAARLVVRSRAPGDRFQAGVRRPARSLKLQYQSFGIAPALRRGPLLCRDDDVPVFVPGLGIDARAVGEDGQAQVTLAWLPRSSAAGRDENAG
jgi:tRNA(Ile)-lysidine synthase